MAQTFIDSNCLVNGNLTATTLVATSASITDAMVVAATGIQATKLQMQQEKHFSQESATASTSGAWVTHVVYGATGTLVSIKAGSVVANVGAATVTVDVLKNGTTVLTGVITLNNTHTAYQLVAGTFSATSLVVGDVLEIKLVATAGGGTLAKGVFAEFVIREATT